MKLYTMFLKDTENEFDRYWNITKQSQLDKIIKKLKEWTKYDKQGRVLCVGFPAKDMSLQKRVFIVKWGHNKELWYQECEYYEELKNRLSQPVK